MNKQERADALKKREKAYYSLRRKLSYIKDSLNELKSHRGHSVAFKMLMLAIDAMQDQIRKGYIRYEARILSQSNHDTLLDMSQSLNREIIKNKALEKKIEEAKTSSGLFIDFVREKMWLK